MIALVCMAVPLPAGANTGTFLDRQDQGDLRMVSYNVLWDTIFPAENPVQAAKFARVVGALDPDVLHLQEIGNNRHDEVIERMNALAPLADGGTWSAYQASDNVIVSKYPLSMQRPDTSPSTNRGVAIALVDLPDSRFSSDFYVMNNHYVCCGDPLGPQDSRRQQHSDALVNWMRDARTPGEHVDLAVQTPMAVVGDLNIVGHPGPLTNLIQGNIVDTGTYGTGSPPDWDGTALADARPRHNATGTADYTWRNDNGSFSPGRLDYVLYTDSVVSAAHSFVLNTVSMTAGDRAAAGLQEFDVTIDNQGRQFDHLPVVVDFRWPESIPGDYNADQQVDLLDYQVWKQAFGTGAASADGNGDGLVDAADYTIWRDHFNTAAAAAAGHSRPVPEPGSWTLLLLGGVGLMQWNRRRWHPICTR